jgi:hypothetical protein
MSLAKRWIAVHLRPIVFALAASGMVVLAGRDPIDPSAPNRAAALVGVLHDRGIAADETDVAWVRGPAGVRGAMLGGARALVRGRAHGEPSDLYLVDARLSPEGVLLAVGDTWNITRTTGVDEGRPLLRGTRAAYTTTLDTVTTGVHTLDFAGRPASEYADFTRLQRWQLALTNLQEKGQTGGVPHHAYALDPIASAAELQWQDDKLLAVVADGRAITLDVTKVEAVQGAGWVRATPDAVARPGALHIWARDRVGAMEWFGEERMFALKAVVFTVLDWVGRAKSKIVKDDTEQKIAEDLVGLGGQQGEKPSFTDPEIGWPPAPLAPVLAPPLPGEGKWISLEGDPFIRQNVGVPASFVTTFVRADKQRPQTRIFITMWDPRQVALHMEAGTVEPVSATGEAGTGTIPRVPEVMRGVVAGFNGGFKADHGEYGMQANGIMYLPPKPFGATVLELRDGTTAFGSWPRSTDVPEDVLSYRQNMTALVQNDKFNPWGRTWWGGTPPGWKDNVHTTRSGVCLTKENFVAYLYGDDVSAEVLAQGMFAARCAYGIHLDMNPGLVGFEFYNVQHDKEYKPLGRPLQPSWEYEGTFKVLPEWHYRARRMIKTMTHFGFPTYIHVDARDFFYLTMRPVLPGPALDPPAAPAQPSEGEWRVKGLPQHGFPYAMATTWLRLDAARPSLKARVLRVDPRAVLVAGTQGTSETTPTVVTLAAPQQMGPHDLGLWLGRAVFTVASSAEDARLLAAGVAAQSPTAGKARVAVGVHDEDGMLEWIELAPDVQADAQTAAVMDKLLKAHGCSTRMLVVGEARALPGGTLDIAGEPTKPPAGPAARLVRTQAPAARPMFDSTPIVPPAVWQPLMNQRVRYFPKPPKHDAGAPASSGTPAPPSSAPN